MIVELHVRVYSPNEQQKFNEYKFKSWDHNNLVGYNMQAKSC